MSDPITLTEAERDWLDDTWSDETTVSAGPFYPVVARILTARLAEVTEMGDHTSCAEAYSDLLVRAVNAEAENARLRDTLARVETLAASWYGVHDGLAADLRTALAGGDS